MDLIERIRDASTKLEPIAAGAVPRWPVFPGIRAVVFDIYGTIIISAAGDISLAGGGAPPEAAMEQVVEALGGTGDPREMVIRYEELIRQSRERRRESGVEFPEVEIREIWRSLLAGLDLDPGRAEEMAVLYECRVNPVWPMEGMPECLEPLRRRGMVLGIVSNAQFYTRLLFPALTGATLEEHGFDPRAMVFSYEEGEGKPSRYLYRKLARNLEAMGIAAQETLYIGNDRLKDIWPAAREGLRTVFFAGDRRSLRWREDDERLAGVEPDAVITHLDQLPRLLES